MPIVLRPPHPWEKFSTLRIPQDLLEIFIKYGAEGVLSQDRATGMWADLSQCLIAKQSAETQQDIREALYWTKPQWGKVSQHCADDLERILGSFGNAEGEELPAGFATRDHFKRGRKHCQAWLIGLSKKDRCFVKPRFKDQIDRAREALAASLRATQAESTDEGDVDAEEEADTLIADLEEELPAAALEYNAFADDPEMYDSRCEDAIMQAYEARVIKEGQDAAAKVPYSSVSYRPQVPKSVPCADRAALLDSLRRKLIDGAWSNGFGVQSSRQATSIEVDEFMRIYLDNKSDDQLKLIEAIPHVNVTPDYIRRCGLGTEPNDRARFVVYFKSVEVEVDALRSLVHAPRANARTFARDIGRFLDDHEVPEHLTWMTAADTVRPSTGKAWVFHVGRFCDDHRTRFAQEVSDVALYNAARGDRPWVECIVRTDGKAQGIQYIFLADHTGLSGAEWSRRMSFDEIFFSLLFLNAAHTNAAWPGSGLPPAPGLGATFSPEVPAGQDLRQTLLHRQLFVQGWTIDRCTVSCLWAIGYRDRTTDPLSFARRHKPYRHKAVQGVKSQRKKVVVLGLDRPFLLPFLVRDGNPGKPAMMCFRPEAFVLSRGADPKSFTMRPLGTNLNRAISSKQGMVDPTSGRLECIFTPGSGPFLEAMQGEERVVEVCLSQLPHTPKHEKRLGIKAWGTDDWVSRKIVNRREISVQAEARDLLFGVPVPVQTLADLALMAVIRDRNPATIGADEAEVDTHVAAASRGQGSLPPTPELHARWLELVAATNAAEMHIMQTTTRPWNATVTLDVAALSLYDNGVSDATSAFGERLAEQSAFLQSIWDEYDISALPGADEYLTS